MKLTVDTWGSYNMFQELSQSCLALCSYTSFWHLAVGWKFLTPQTWIHMDSYRWLNAKNGLPRVLGSLGYAPTRKNYPAEAANTRLSKRETLSWSMSYDWKPGRATTNSNYWWDIHRIYIYIYYTCIYIHYIYYTCIYIYMYLYIIYIYIYICIIHIS